MSKCACGCGVELARVGRRGPAPSYASAACRKRAERRRRAESVLLPELVAMPVMRVPSRDIDKQIERALLETNAIAYQLLRLGADARPELGWRCLSLGRGILEAMATSFPQVK